MHNIVGAIGLVLGALGLWIIWDALHAPLTVAGPGFESIVNLQMMHVQMINVLLGIGAVIAGVIMFCAFLLINSRR